MLATPAAMLATLLAIQVNPVAMLATRVPLMVSQSNHRLRPDRKSLDWHESDLPAAEGSFPASALTVP